MKTAAIQKCMKFTHRRLQSRQSKALHDCALRVGRTRQYHSSISNFWLGKKSAKILQVPNFGPMVALDQHAETKRY